MCGIALIGGDGADPVALRAMLATLRPRGEITEVASGPRVLAGTRRLRIVDRERAVQPWIFAGGRRLLCLNGEIYNHVALRAELAGLGRTFRTGSDTEVVAEAFGQWGNGAVGRLRGEFAFTIADTESGRVYLARDLIGVKPLYWSSVAGRLHVASEVKALVHTGAPVREVPPGSHGWAEPDSAPRLRHYSSALDPDLADHQMLEDAAEAAALVRGTLADAVAARLDTDLPVGVILSGGLDSALTLMHVRQRHPDCVAFTVGTPDCEDLRYARRLTGDLGVRHEVIELVPRQIRLAQISEAIAISELTEYGDIINAVVSVPLFRRIAQCGIKVVLTGDGADELFGGYPMYDQVSTAQARRLFLHKITNLGRTELQRVDRTSMAAGVEARVPFLDPAMVALALRLPMALKVRHGTEKWILRQAFADVLPDYIRARHKNPMSHASGLHERARLYKPAFARIHRSFGYDCHEPFRRDFSVVLEQCGNDLDLAMALASSRLDYSAREHVRDLAGAARWNARTLVGVLAGAGRGRPGGGLAG